MSDDLLRAQINDLIRDEIQEGINDYLETQEESEKSGLGFVNKEDEKEVNLETAVEQLERYRLIQNNWCQQYVSATISYSADEVEDIVDWLCQNWDQYVGVSFIYRNDPTKTAKDLGYLYLPQEVVPKDEYNNYVERLLPIELESANTFEEIKDEDCATGACPIK